MLLSNFFRQLSGFSHTKRQSVAARRSTRQAIERLEERRLLTTFSVNSTFDNVDVSLNNGVAADFNGQTTLRAAIQESNANATADTIVLGAGTFTLSRAGANENNAVTGDLDITGLLTITGAGAANTIIDGADLDRIFHIGPGARVVISGVTIRNGTAASAGGVHNFGTLTINDSIIENNIASSATNAATTSLGGGIGNEGGTLNLNNVIVRANSSRSHGGGLYSSGGTVTIVDSTFTRNTSGVDGGGLSIYRGNLSVTGGAINRNTSGRDGGGLSVEDARATVRNATVANNIAGDDAGGINVFNNVTMTVSNSTILGNTATGFGGGVRAFDGSSIGIVNSGISRNQAGKSGGGIDIDDATVEVQYSTVRANNANRDGGGIDNFLGTLRISNSTISDNTATGSGGGIFNAANSATLSSLTTLVNATITANSAIVNGGGLFNSGTLRLGNTLVAKNSALPLSRDVLGFFNTLSTNLIGELGNATGLVNGVFGDLVGSALGPLDPKLGPLQDNGGGTLSYALLPGSPAIDGGTNAGAATQDQTGRDRNLDGDLGGVSAVDIGAVEYIPPALVLVVNTVADTRDPIPGNGLGLDAAGFVSLRSAIQEANARPGAERIEVPAGTYSLGFAGINEDAAFSGDLDLTGNLTIVGAGKTDTIIDAGDLDRVFHILTGANVVLRNMTIRNGLSLFAGGIWNRGNLTLDNVIVADNVASNLAAPASGNGGNILVDHGTLTLTNSSIQNGTANGNGGGLYSLESTVSLTNAVISGNTAVLSGGGIVIDRGEVTLTGSTVQSNSVTAGSGGGAYNQAGTLTLNTSFVSSNTATVSGGGIAAAAGTVGLYSSTVNLNTSTDDGGGIALAQQALLQGTSAKVLNNTSSDYGGGIHAVGSVITLDDCWIDSNKSRLSGGGFNVEQGQLTLTNSSVTNNAAGSDGGGIDGYLSRVVLTNATVSGNTAVLNGAGIVNYSGGLVRLLNSTVAGNVAKSDGGGIWNTGTVELGNTIVAANTVAVVTISTAGTTETTTTTFTPDDISGFVTTLGANLVGVNAGTSGLTNGLNRDLVGTIISPINSKLGALVNNGGTGLTRLLASDSPAIDAGNANAALLTDARGRARASDGNLDGTSVTDIGATEYFGIQLNAAAGQALTVRLIRSGDQISLINTTTQATQAGPVAVNGVDRILLIGGDLNDSVIVDFSGGNPLSGGGIEFRGNGTTDSDSLQLSGGSATRVFHSINSLSSGAIDIDGSIVTYSGLEPLTETLTADTRWVKFDSTVVAGLVTGVTVALTDTGTITDGLQRITRMTAAAVLDFTAPTNGLTIITSGSDDVLTVGVLDSTQTSRVTILLSDGADRLDAVLTATSLLVEASIGNDTIITGSGNDSVVGGIGDDRIFLGAGNDTASGESGADSIDGDAGTDSLNGGAANDTLSGGVGNDVLSGGDGNDSLVGAAGIDTLVEEQFPNFTLTATSSTGLGSDVLSAIEAARLTGNSGPNRINTTVFTGAVTIDGGAGNDTILTGSGSDSLVGGPGLDSIDGGAGNDFLSGGDGGDALLGGLGNDSIDGGIGNDVVTGGDGNDTIIGGSGDDSVRGGGGNDSIIGLDGNDTLKGDLGDDYIDGGIGADALAGGDGNDYLLGGDGNDVMVGQNGNDTLLGGLNNDSIQGGLGIDIVNGQGGTDRVAGSNGTNRRAETGDQVNGLATEIDEAFVLSASWLSLLA